MTQDTREGCRLVGYKGADRGVTSHIVLPPYTVQFTLEQPPKEHPGPDPGVPLYTVASVCEGDGSAHLWPSLTAQDWRGELVQKTHGRKICFQGLLLTLIHGPLLSTTYSTKRVTETQSSSETVRWWRPPKVSMASRQTAGIKTGNWI